MNEASDRPATGDRSTRTWRAIAAAFLLYLVVALLLWWNVSTTHPSATTCGCGDAALFLWFFEWPAYALAHGHIVSTRRGCSIRPGSTSSRHIVMALGIVLAPVTWLRAGGRHERGPDPGPRPLGPGHVLALRRSVRWQPAAFVGAWSTASRPFSSPLAIDQLNTAVLVLPPSSAGPRRALVRQPRRPRNRRRSRSAGRGPVLREHRGAGDLRSVHGGGGGPDGDLLVGIRCPEELGPRLGHALTGSATVVGGAAVLLAYPVWFLLRGPAT